jgi:hypothetical protein
MTLVPETKRAGLTAAVTHAFSSVLSAVVASVVYDTVADGMLLRNTSVPFTYTTAPSSRFSASVSDPKSEGSLTVNAWRK